VETFLSQSFHVSVIVTLVKKLFKKKINYFSTWVVCLMLVKIRFGENNTVKLPKLLVVGKTVRSV
jgi:hypothetical protein